VDVQLGRLGLVDGAQKHQEFLVTVLTDQLRPKMKQTGASPDASCTEGGRARYLIAIRVVWEPVIAVANTVAVLPLICGAFMALATPAWADISRNDAATLVHRAGGSRVLSVDTTQANGRPAWRVKVVTPQGEVRAILIDVASGKALLGSTWGTTGRPSLTHSSKQKWPH
jgi:hypothetical protein